MADLTYVVYEHCPAVHDDRQAWFIFDQDIGWRPAPYDEVVHDGGIISRDEFRRLLSSMFPDAPDLPPALS